MLSASTMGSVPMIVITGVLALWLFPQLWRRGRMKEAIALSVSAPAWLVPAAFTTIAATLFAQAGRNVHEQPFAIMGSGSPLARIAPWQIDDRTLLCALAALTMAIGIAGQIGMLRAWVDGRAAGSADFWRGIRDHTLTIFVGKLLLSFALGVILWWMHPRDFRALVYLVPNFLIAALVGTTALHPGRPLRALAAAWRVGTTQMQGVTHIVIAHSLALVAIWTFTGQGGFSSASRLGPFASSLSHCSQPILMTYPAEVQDFVALIASCVVSSVCLSAMFLGVTKGFALDKAEAARAAAVTGTGTAVPPHPRA